MKLQKMETAWFALKDDPDGAEFEIVHLRAGEVDDIIAKTHRQKYEMKEEPGGETSAVPVLETDRQGERELTVIAAVADWKNVFDEDGRPMACDEDNKRRLCRELSEDGLTAFLGFIRQSRRTMAAKIREREHQREKN